ncbi:Uncharacterised protein [Vibrio cholerae]|nr:Uncharacterised protein [Vibrio cholerae]
MLTHHVILLFIKQSAPLFITARHFTLWLRIALVCKIQHLLPVQHCSLLLLDY